MISGIFKKEITERSRLGRNVPNRLKKTLSSSIDSDVIKERFRNSWGLDLVLNSQGFRSNEFTEFHQENHFLFAGCSNTFGYAMAEEEVWSQRLLSMLELAGIKNSGHFNISVPGTGVFEIVSNIFRYCNLYGIPKAIFVQILNVTRFYDIDLKGEEVVYANIPNPKKTSEIKSLELVLETYSYQYLMMLESFCKKSGIDLFIFHWSPVPYFSENPELDNFYPTDVSDLASAIQDHELKNPLDRYSLLARDSVHPGNGEHKYRADLAFNLYNKRVKEKDVS